MTHRKAPSRRTHHHAKDNNNHVGCLAALNFKRAPNHHHAAVSALPTPRHPYNLRQTVQRTARIERHAAAVAAARIEQPSVVQTRTITTPPDGRRSPSPTTTVLKTFGYNTRSDLILGSGHFSKVYRATKRVAPAVCTNPTCTEYHPPAQAKTEYFAVKVIRMDHVGSDYRLKFLPRELECWKKLEHPNLCKLFEILRFNDMYVFMVMEFCPMGDVLSHVQKNGALPDLIGRRWMKEVVDAVSYMHSMGIAHRDIKAENCLITADHRVKLADFGFAIEVTNGSYSRTYCGSRTYSSPEILSGIPYDVFKADVWSLGCLVYVAMTGTMPFREDGQPTPSMVEQQRRRTLRYPSFVGEDVIHAIDCLLQFNQAARPTIDRVRELPFFADAPQMPSTSTTPNSSMTSVFSATQQQQQLQAVQQQQLQYAVQQQQQQVRFLFPRQHQAPPQIFTKVPMACK
uniref:Protein kinase domain-containing protein n=1 Tax=Panagrellus redivivus TaxID=6233 RepID=A0A7E4VXX4_PANRE